MIPCGCRIGASQRVGLVVVEELVATAEELVAAEVMVAAEREAAMEGQRNQVAAMELVGLEELVVPEEMEGERGLVGSADAAVVAAAAAAAAAYLEGQRSQGAEDQPRNSSMSGVSGNSSQSYVCGGPARAPPQRFFKLLL